MQKLVAKVKGWWTAGGPESNGPLPYAVECACGQVVRGARQASHQVVPCPHCGAKVFVLPQSPLIRVAAPPVRPSARLGQPQPGRRRLRRWTIAAALALALFSLIGWFIWQTKAPPDPSPFAETTTVDSRLKAARHALLQGKFRLAVQELDAARALALLKSQPGTGRREVEQLRRQAALVADLGEVPLQEVLRHAAETAPDEWRLVFPHRYQGKAVLFDSQVSRDAAGKFQLEHFLFLGDETARVAIGDLDLFRHLRLDRPCRLIVGARLAGVGREPSGGWVIRLEPGSGVLMTDRDVVTTACPFLRDDPELPEVLGRQQSWLADIP